MAPNNDSDAAAAASPQAGQGRPLPKKEADLFKNVVRFYESKQYKKGLKNADAVLRRFPDHGETLCMKGLIVNAAASSRVGEDKGAGSGGKGGRKNQKKEKEEPTEGDRRKEAIDLVKRGLMMDMRSHVCWHVYGLLHRSSRNYAEAVKAYKQALRIDPGNLQILRDLGLLQVQLRDLTGFRDTRLQLLQLRPSSKIHWLTYAVAVHAAGDREAAAKVLDSYAGTLEPDDAEFQRGVESGELALYKNQILGECADRGAARALAHLDEIAAIVVDRTGWLLAKVGHELALGSFAAAKDTCARLFAAGVTEDHAVHGAYMCALLECDADTCAAVGELRGTATLATLRPLTGGERATLTEAYGGASQGTNGEGRGGLARQYPRSHAIQRIWLTLLDPAGPEFAEALDQYCRRLIRRGVPSLGHDLSSLYLTEAEGKRVQSPSNGASTAPATIIHYTLAEDPLDIQSHPVYRIIVLLVESYIDSLASSNTFPASNDPSESSTPAEEDPSTLLWAWYLRAVLHLQAAQFPAGLALVDLCITHTPTAVDFYELKSRLLEEGGDLSTAAEVADAGRDLDRQDRYVNNFATRALLRAGREQEARERIAMFTRHEGDPDRNLYDMQCTWYELELADCLRRKGELGRSLRKYMAVIKHYEDFHEDQFDFHMYCIRKVTLRTYCKLLKFEDELWGQPHYGRAAEGVVRIYLHLTDHPESSQEDMEPDYSKMTPAERKKAKNIARKKKKAAATQARGAQGARKDESNKNNTAKDVCHKKKAKPHIIDEDPEGKELLALDHLDEARKFAAILVRHAPKRITAWALQYDVSIRRGKMLLALQALFKMKAIDPNNHQLFSRIVHFSQKHFTKNDEGQDNAAVGSAAEQVITSEFPNLTNGQPLSGFVASAAKHAKDNTVPRSGLPMRIAVARAVLSTGSADCTSTASALVLDSGLNVPGVSAESCREALSLMATLGCQERMMELVMDKFPFAKDFS